MNDEIDRADPSSVLKRMLDERREQGLLRSLAPSPEGMVDFSSNDYLGLSFYGRLEACSQGVPWEMEKQMSGSTGSRLISGNHRQLEVLEEELAHFHRGHALVFNSGYDANVGLLSCLAGRGDTYISDSLSHASLIDGMRLSYAQRLRFRHNDLDDLEKQLLRAKGRVFIIAEAVYSMDGDQARLQDMLCLAEKHGASLIVDEAHSIGVFGDRGGGLCQALGIEGRVFARIYTYGKAPACHGASIIGSKELKEYLVNFCRSFIYTTAMPPHAARQIQASYRAMAAAQEQRECLQKLISHFRKALGEVADLLPSESPIQSILVPGNAAVTERAAALQAAGFWVKPIRHPTVPEGAERIRICLHAFNTQEEIERLAVTFA